MAPKVYGSSTIGVKKSTVCTRASSGVSLYTPASSAVSNPTSTFSSAQRGTLASTRSNNFGLSLDAQPAAFTWAVNFLSWVVSSILPSYNNGMRRTAVFSAVLLLALAVHAGFARTADRSATSKKASRASERNGWIQVHLEGTPGEIGFQHGYLLAAEIKDTFKAISDRDGPRREEGLGILPQGRGGGVLAARGAGVSRRTERHCRRAARARA